MSTTRREVPVTSIYAKAVFTGNVSGDVTTITLAAGRKKRRYAISHDH